VYAQHASDSMSCTVIVIKAGCEQMSSGKNIKVFSCKAPILGPNYSLEIDDTKENSSVRFSLEISWFISTKVSSPSDVSCAIEVLTSRVE